VKEKTKSNQTRSLQEREEARKAEEQKQSQNLLMQPVYLGFRTINVFLLYLKIK
jgi:hypothetical protein